MSLEKKSQIILNFVREIDRTKAEQRVLKKISDLLTDFCNESKKDVNLLYKQLKCFYSKRIPIIPIKDFLEHIYKYTKINTSTLVLMLIYIDRLCNIQKCKLSFHYIHKLILGSIILAIKYNEDEYYSLKLYAKIGGISLSEMINYEFDFINLINYNLHVNEELFSKYNDFLLSSDSDDEDSDNYNYDDEDNNNGNF